MEPHEEAQSTAQTPSALSNAEIADRLAGLAQLLSTQKENPYKVKAYLRAAARIRSLPDSLDELVKEDANLTHFPGIGAAIASAIREIVLTGKLRKLDTLRGQASPEVASLADYPRLDPRRVLRVYKKLRISSIESLREKLESGEIESMLGLRMAQHVRQGLSVPNAMLLYRADELRDAIEEFLLAKCAVKTVQVVGACRRRVEVVEEIAFVIETDDFPAVVRRMQRYGGRTELLESSPDGAIFALAAGITLRLRLCSAPAWGLCLVMETGSEAHLKILQAVTGRLTSLSGNTTFTTETAFYRKFGLAYIEPELREGYDEVELAGKNALPELVTAADIRGELHAHSTSSDGAHSIEQMAAAAHERGYEYVGISDHSQSLKIARGVSVEDLWRQIRYIDKLNAKSGGIRILKSAEVDILADGSLDYPDELLKELDYTVCSIHSRFGLNREQQTERIVRAMDNRYFNILGHPTGRLLLKRPGYEIDLDRIIEQARRNGCFFEINSSPDRLDLSAGNARRAAAAGVLIAVNTDSHSMGELQLVRRGLDQARRAGLAKSAVLNSRPWQKLHGLFKR
ncbi:MAG TPA: PHP domain-containing protein [Bryobacteraceae bacterium]|nr:PHP domain-containing protein [Bryobacteraceae bacterium]